MEYLVYTFGMILFFYTIILSLLRDGSNRDDHLTGVIEGRKGE
jgi:hypothetical protein